MALDNLRRPYNLASLATPSSYAFLMRFNAVDGAKQVALDVEIQHNLFMYVFHTCSLAITGTGDYNVVREIEGTGTPHRQSPVCISGHRTTPP